MDDPALFEERHVRITTTVVRIGPTTYPLSGITSVRTLHKASTAPLLLGGSGVVLLVFAALALSTIAERLVEAGIMGGAFGLALIGSAVLAHRSNKGSRVLVLGTAGGDRQSLASADGAFVERVRVAIEEALKRRG